MESDLPGISGMSNDLKCDCIAHNIKSAISPTSTNRSSSFTFGASPKAQAYSKLSLLDQIQFFHWSKQVGNYDPFKSHQIYYRLLQKNAVDKKAYNMIRQLR